MQPRRNRLAFELLEPRRVLAASVGADDFVNTPGDGACVLTSSAAGILETAGDIDVFAIDLSTDRAIKVTLTSESLTAFRIDLSSTDAAGNFRVVATEFGSNLRWSTENEGRFYIGVSSELGLGSYELSVSTVEDIPDVGGLAAPLLSRGNRVASEFESSGDVDVFAFDAIAGEIIVVDVERVTVPYYPFVRARSDAVDPRGFVATGRGAQLIFRVASSGRHYLELWGTTNGGYQLGTYAVTISDVRDDHPDEFNAKVATLTLDDPVAGIFEVASDKDGFAFEAVAGDTYQLSVMMGTLSSLPALQVDSPAGTRILRSEAATVGWKASETGRYFISATPVNSLGSYDLTMSLVEDDFPDSVEGAVSLLFLNMTLSAKSQYFQDVDVFGLPLVAGDGIKVTLLAPLDLKDDAFQLRLLAPDGSELPQPNNGSESTLTWKVKETGQHFVEVVASDSLASYELTVESLTDDHPDGFLGDPLRVEFDGSFSGDFEATGDVDLFVLAAEAGQVVQFKSEPQSSVPTIRILRSNGDVVPHRRYGSWRMPASEEYFIEISSKGSGAYELTPFVLAIDDHPDSPTNAASMLTIGTSTTLTIVDAFDRDVLAFDAEVGQVLEFSSPSHGARFAVLLDDGSVLAKASTMLHWKAPSSDRFYVQISGSTGRSYEITTRLLVTDDHADTLDGRATIIGRDAAVLGVLDVEDDIDVFVYELAAGEIFSLALVPADPANRLAATIDVSQLAGSGVSSIQHESGRAWTSSTAGPVYVLVEAFHSIGPYELTLTSLGSDVPQLPDVAAAPELQLASPIFGQIDFQNDRDVYAFDAQAGEALEFTATGNNLGGLVFSTSFATQLPSDGRTNQRWIWQAASSGRHYVEVPFSSLIKGSYELSMTAASTNRAGFGTTSVLFEESYGIVAFAAGEASIVELNLVPAVALPSGSPLPKLKVVNADGLEISALAVNNQTLRFKAPTTSSYFAYLTNRVPEPLGQYDVTLALGQDDHSDSISDQASVLVPNKPLRGRVDFANDLDVFAFDQIVDEVVKLSVSPIDPSSLGKFELRILAEDGKLIRQGTADLSWKADIAGRYYISISSRCPDSYQLSMSATVDDHVDEVGAGAALVELDTTIRGTIEYRNDSDVFAIDVEQDQLLLFSAIDQLSSSALVRIVSSDGTTVASRYLHSPFYWQASSASTYFLMVSAPNSAMVEYQFSMAQEADDHPNDIASDRITVVRADVPIHAIFELPDDVDVFAIDVGDSAGFRYSIPNSHIPGRRFRVLAHDGSPVHDNQQQASPEFVLLEAGRYFIEITSGQSGGNYVFELVSVPDDYPNTNRVDLPLIEERVTIAGKLEIQVDEDVFAFQAQAGNVYRVIMTSEQTQFRVHVESPDGRVFPTSQFRPNYDWKAEESGLYFLHISPFRHLGAYRFYVTPIVDDYPDIASDDSPVLQLDVTRTGQFTPQHDIDVFAFDVAQDTVLRANVEFRSRTCCEWEVLEADGVTEVERFDDGTFKAIEGGRHYLRVHAGRRLGLYSVTIATLAVNDHPDTLSLTATATPLNSKITGNLDHLNDIDVFAIDVAEAKRISITLTMDSIKVGIRVLGADGKTWVSNEYKFKLDLTWTPTAGRYYVEVTPWWNATGKYDLDLQAVPVPAYGEGAAIIQANTSLSGQFGDGLVTELFAFDASLDQFYSVNLETVGTSTVRLTSADGEILPVGREGPLWKTNAAGRHYISITIWSQSAEYELTLNAIPDDHLDAPSEAIPLVEYGEILAGEFAQRDDREVFAFDAMAGDVVRVAHRDTSTFRNIDQVRVLWSDGKTELAHIRGKNVWRTAASGRHFIVIDGQRAGPFSFDFDVLPDDHVDFATSDATRLDFAAPNFGANEAAFDVDMFAFAAVGGQIFDFTVNGSPAGLRVVTDDQEVVASGSGGRLVWQAVETAKYYVELTWLWPQAYELNASVKMDDNVSVVDRSATRIEPGMMVNGVFEFSGNVDVFAFEAAVDQVYRFDALSDFGLIPRVRVLNQNGTVAEQGIVRDDVWQAPLTGTYYLEVSTPVRTGDYTMSIHEQTDPRDLTNDAEFTAADIDLLFAAVRDSSRDRLFDINDDGEVDTLDTNVFLDRFGILGGDANLDAVVNFADFLQLGASFGRPGGWGNGDFNGDGRIDFVDFLALSTNFSKGRASSN